MKNILEFLKRDQKVNDTFINKLELVGLDVNYGSFGYWSHEPYIKIGRDIVWLVSTECDNNNTYCTYRYQNEVIKDIYRVIKEQKKLAEESDQMVNEFFEKLSK